MLFIGKPMGRSIMISNDYKIWMNKVSLWANTNDMAWIIKIAKRL